MNNNDILNKYIDLIDKGYCCACNELNCIDNFPQAKITHAIRKLQQENKQLKEVIAKANKYLHTRGIQRWSNGTHYRGLDGLQAQVLENILEEVSD